MYSLYEPIISCQFPSLSRLSTEHTINSQPGQDGLSTIILLPASAAVTRVANISDWFETRPLSNLQVLHSLANLYDHSGSFMASTLGPKLGHLGSRPIIQHEMYVAHAETGCIKLDEHLFGPGNRYSNILDLLRSGQSLLRGLFDFCLLPGNEPTHLQRGSLGPH
jgi:hypothetical protein